MLQLITKPTGSFEAELTASLNEIEAQITAAAKADGALNMPYPVGDNCHHYFDPFLHKYHDLAAKNRTRYTPQTARHVVVGNNTAYEIKQRELQNKKAECARRKAAVDAAIEHTPEPAKYRKSKLITFAILSLAVLDSGLNIQLFQSWGFSLLQSWLFAPFMAALFAATAHIAPKAFSRIKNPQARKYAAIAFALFVIVLFYLLGTERAAYLSEQTGYPHSSLPFTILSTLFLGVAIALSHFYLPYTDEEKEAIRKYKKCLNDKINVDGELNAIERQISALTAQKTETEVTGAHTLETAYINHKRIETAARNGLAIYIQVNKRHRNDGLCPDCFNKPFDFDFPDFNLKPTSHENAE